MSTMSGLTHAATRTPIVPKRAPRNHIIDEYAFARLSRPRAAPISGVAARLPPALRIPAESAVGAERVYARKRSTKHLADFPQPAEAEAL